MRSRHKNMEDSFQNVGKVLFKAETKPSQFYKVLSQSLELVTTVIVINVASGGFSGKDLKWLAHVTVQLEVSDYSQPSDYTVRLIRAKYSSRQ